ncbi:MAG: cytochrome b/b6 domain-containing protein [Pseudomonadales bacterium]|nr:cytochrome b/b6 domain-containing protein [Pseudomonadales bacterium]
MSTKTIRVWDVAVRVFHWSLVSFFLIAYVTGDEENAIHVYSGYAVIGLVLFRLLWGFIGSRHARFSDFLAGPGTVLRYVKSLLSGEPERYEGHNPLGGWMIVALLVGVLATGYSGLEVYGAEGHGPLAGGQVPELVPSTAWADEDDDDDGERGGRAGEHEGGHEGGEDFWEEIHEFFANFTLFLAFLHVGGVLVASLLHRENLVRAMITGMKEVQDAP